MRERERGGIYALLHPHSQWLRPSPSLSFFSYDCPYYLNSMNTALLLFIPLLVPLIHLSSHILPPLPSLSSLLTFSSLSLIPPPFALPFLLIHTPYPLSPFFPTISPFPFPLLPPSSYLFFPLSPSTYLLPSQYYYFLCPFLISPSP